MGSIAAITFFLVFGFLYGALKNSRPEGTKSNSGWVGLAVLCVLLGGLFFASTTRNESLGWFFGIALWVSVPAMLLFAIGMGAGRRYKRERHEKS